MANVRPQVVQYITDRPNEVVYRDNIMTDVGLTASQVTAAVLRTQRDSPIGDRIETIVRGNAWRYVPPPEASSNRRPSASNPSLPLTSLIREYMVAHPHEPIWVNQLVEYTGKRIDQVRVGVNNMRRIIAHSDIVPYVYTEIGGQLWRFDPPPGWRPYGSMSSSASSAVPVPTSTVATSSSSVVPTSVVPTSDNNADDGNVPPRMFEEVGTTDDGRIYVRDANNNMYVLTKV